MTPLRILMLDNEFPPLGGGTAVVNQHLLEEMAVYPDVEVDLVTSSLHRRLREMERFAARIRIYKVPVDNRDIHHSTHIELLRYSARGLHRAYELHASRPYDVTFAFSGLPAGAMALALESTHGLSYVVSLQGRDVPGFDAGYRQMYPLVTPLIRRVWRRAKVVIAISEDHRRLALETEPHLPIHLIHNGVDTTLFRPAAERSLRPLTFLCAARLVERKGHRHLLRAFADAQSRCAQPLRLILAGQGDSETSLRALAGELGIAAAVDFRGYVARDRIADVYRDADAFVLASQNEGMSIALLEAMASALPVVVTRAGGTAELVVDGVNGLIVRWADVAGLSATLQRLAADEALRQTMAEANRRRAQDFSWPEITRQYLELCERAATSATTRPAPAHRANFSPRPRVCILASQYFAWGKYGGFGSMSRKLAATLAAAGCVVSVIVPRRPGQRPEEVIDGVPVRSFSPLAIGEAWRLLRASDADIFHSQDPTLLSWLAQKAHPGRAHLVTCRDPRDLRDWWIEFALASRRRRWLTPFNFLTESAALVRRAVQGADGIFCPAFFLREKVKRVFHPRTEPAYLPNLIDVPRELPRKSERPTFSFVARWDRRKRPELFLELAERYPEHQFVAFGSGEDERHDLRMRQRYGHLPNLELPGFVDRFADARLSLRLGESWALVNTAAREGLPLTFLEAAAHGCAIVSGVDPDGFASRFGVQVVDDDFGAGIERLLREDPLARGGAARAHVQMTCETSVALAAHLAQYEKFR